MFVTLHTNVIVVTIRISIADLTGGGGNTDFCPGRQTPSRCHWVGPVYRPMPIGIFLSISHRFFIMASTPSQTQYFKALID